MTQRYSIFAAPRTKEGVYRFTESKPLYRKDFASLDAMMEFWRTDIRPHTTQRVGAEFELAMLIWRTGTDWVFHEQPRYASEPLLTKEHLVYKP
ncbi:MAG: hypothetical protein AAF465_13685 [Pseudomonadota bacterium]